MEPLQAYRDRSPSERLRTHGPLYAGMAVMLLITLFSLHQPFFWDGILNARQALWYQTEPGLNLVVPENMDAGHPPLFSLYLSLVPFTMLSLTGFHLLMLPLLLGIVWQAWRLGRHLNLSPAAQGVNMLLLLAEPTILAQSTQISSDILLLFAWLLGLNAVLRGEQKSLMLAGSLLVLTNLRGVFGLALLGLADLLWGSRPIRWLPRLLPYLLPAVLWLSWLSLHHAVQGWWFSPPDATYGTHREILGLGGMLRNAGVMAWRVLDFGRVGLWLLLLWGAWRLRAGTGAFRTAFFLMLLPLLGFSLFFLPFSNPVGHRYFMPAFALAVLAFAALWETFSTRVRMLSLTAVLTGFISGHFWVYPDHISKGWDGHLAFRPWFGAQAEMDTWIHNQGIPTDSILTEFPNLFPPRVTRATEGYHAGVGRDQLPFHRARYVWDSNLMNGFTDAERDTLSTWILRHEIRSGQVWTRLWERRQP